MRENSAPLVNSAPTTFSSMKLGFSCYCNNNQQPTKIHIGLGLIKYYMDFGKAVACNSKKNPISLSWMLSGPSFTKGAEFSRILRYVNRSYNKVEMFKFSIVKHPGIMSCLSSLHTWTDFSANWKYIVILLLRFIKYFWIWFDFPRKPSIITPYPIFYFLQIVFGGGSRGRGGGGWGKGLCFSTCKQGPKAKAQGAHWVVFFGNTTYAPAAIAPALIPLRRQS